MNTNNSPSPEPTPSRNLTFRRFFTPRILGTLVLLLAALGAGAAAVTKDIGGHTAADRPGADLEATDSGLIIQRVETVVLQPAENIQQARTYTGIVTARRTAELGFERSARINRIYFDDGDLVTAGQAIAEVETRRLEAKRRETTARHAAAVAMLDELVAGPRTETIAAARAEVVDLQSQLELRRRTLERTQKLRQQNAATDQDIDNSELSQQSTEARLNAASKRLEELEAGTRSEQIDAQRATVDQLVAALADIDIELDESVLKAPFNGQIAARTVDEGTVVAPGQAVVRLVEHEVLEARIGFPLQAVQTVSIGEEVDLTVGEIQCQGTLVRKLPEIDLATRTQTVVIEINQASSLALLPGQIVHTSVIQQIDKEGFLLPTAALLPGVRGLWSAFAVTDQEGKRVIRRRHVEVLHTSGDQVLVRGTITAGDRIVISGVQRLVDGQQVAVVE